MLLFVNDNRWIFAENKAAHVVRAGRRRRAGQQLHQHRAGVRPGEVPRAAGDPHHARVRPAAAARGQLRRRLPRVRRGRQSFL